jgi:hypothetical protein
MDASAKILTSYAQQKKKTISFQFIAKMVRNGVVVVLPLYLLVLVLEVMVIMEPPTFLCHCTLFIGRLELTVQTKVTVLPNHWQHSDLGLYCEL